MENIPSEITMKIGILGAMVEEIGLLQADMQQVEKQT
tara:strand:- start:69937 stop:70047 length:111 start_codon:yes stop_codon:yes gene_type:complete